MDIEEFQMLVNPSMKRSRLELFRPQILELKAKGYANRQVRDWLAANGLSVSQQSVQQFLKKNTKLDSSNGIINEDDCLEKTENNSSIKNEEKCKTIGKIDTETLRMKREREANRFIKDEPSNQLLKAFKDK
jgi:predicted transcriptional regulator